VDVEVATTLGLEESIVLGNLQERQRRPDLWLDGRPWVRLSCPEWQQDFPWWTVPTLRRILLTLRRRGVVEARPSDPQGRNKSLLYTVTDVAVSSKVHCSDGPHRSLYRCSGPDNTWHWQPEEGLSAVKTKVATLLRQVHPAITDAAVNVTVDFVLTEQLSYQSYGSSNTTDNLFDVVLRYFERRYQPTGSRRQPLAEFDALRAGLNAVGFRDLSDCHQNRRDFKSLISRLDARNITADEYVQWYIQSHTRAKGAGRYFDALLDGGMVNAFLIEVREGRGDHVVIREVFDCIPRIVELMQYLADSVTSPSIASMINERMRQLSGDTPCCSSTPLIEGVASILHCVVQRLSDGERGYARRKGGFYDFQAKSYGMVLVTDKQSDKPK